MFCCYNQACSTQKCTSRHSSGDQTCWVESKAFVFDVSVFAQEKPCPPQFHLLTQLPTPPSISCPCFTHFLNHPSLQTSGHFRSLPHSTNMFFGALPRILWHSPMPTPNLLPCLTQIQRTARGQWRWRGVHPYNYGTVMVQLALEREKGMTERRGKKQRMA